jgi:putative DNA methylase
MRKKLIEVALPLDAINRESAREKSIRHGHPSTLHLWWARRPLAACRAVLFASLIDDPDQDSVPQPLLARIDQLPKPDLPATEWSSLSLADQRRQKLFTFIEHLVRWENSTDECILTTARELILAATEGNPPPVLDPFCGGGSIPLEAQRLGLEAHASDLNPVAVLITKALIEIPPKFANRPPVNPENRTQELGDRDALPRVDGVAEGDGGRYSVFSQTWKGAAGLAADVRFYGRWMRDEADKRIGHLYPKAKLPDGKAATVIAWLWARTVTCPNPACGAQMPLVRSFWLSTKKGKETWVEPIVDRATKTVRFEVRTGTLMKGDAERVGVGTGFTGDRGKKIKATFRCVVCGNGVAKGDYLDSEADAGRMGVMPLAIVAEGQSGRVYLSFNDEHTRIAIDEARAFLEDPSVREQLPTEPARGTFASNAQGRIYGFKTFADYFTPRQLVALTTFSGLVAEARVRVRRDAVAAGLPDDGVSLDDGGTGATAYADAVATYLAFAVDRLAESECTLSRWQSTGDFVAGAFSRQALAMLWDYAEVNPFSHSTRNFADAVEWTVEVCASLPASSPAFAVQTDAREVESARVARMKILATDPPYYDNIGYADLSDFFYVWLRRSLGSIYPGLFSTLLTPKAQELIASPYRFGGNADEARAFFEDGLGKAFERMRDAQTDQYPMAIFYAFKQTEEEGNDDGAAGLERVASTGWETMLEGLLRARFSITGTWPMRTERGARSNSLGANALASSIVLACRPRPESAPVATRREFITALRQELPDALKKLQRTNIAPVDLAQAAIGPGMAVFSRYAKVLESDGSPMRVRTALQLINAALDEILAEQEGEYDAETRWTIAWFEQHGLADGPFGEADVLSRAKDCSVQSLADLGLVIARAGKVRLVPRDQLPANWDPAAARRVTVWEVVQRLGFALETGGDAAAAALVRKIPSLGEIARDLAYRLYVTSERKGWTHEALAYNSLVVAWPEIARLAAESAPPSDRLF